MITTAEIDDSLISCGVHQLHGLFDLFELKGIDEEGEDVLGNLVPGRLIETFRAVSWLPPGKQYIFSDLATRTSPGSQLARFIRKNGYGKVTTGPVSVNPNTKNKIRVWIWVPSTNFRDKVKR